MDEEQGAEGCVFAFSVGQLTVFGDFSLCLLGMRKRRDCVYVMM
jgi:hypothetical protein